MAKDKSREKDPCRVQLKDVRLSHPHIFRPQAYGDGDGEPAYSANFLIPKDTKLGQRNIDLIEDAIEAAKDKKWGNKPPKIGRTKRFFKDGDDEDYRDKEENVNHMIATARNYRQPKLFDRDKTEVVEADDVLYAGCYVDAIITVWAQDNKFGQRINASLEAIRFRRDGEPFGAPPSIPMSSRTWTTRTTMTMMIVLRAVAAAAMMTTMTMIAPLAAVAAATMTTMMTTTRIARAAIVVTAAAVVTTTSNFSGWVGFRPHPVPQ